MALLWKHFLAVSIFTAVFSVASAQDVKFDKAKLVLSSKTISVELAKTDAEHERGLMFRKNLPENEGMLFVFKDEDVRAFWMKNTIIDLSIGYFDKDRTLIDIQQMKATSILDSRPPSYPSAKPAMYALEMNKTWFAKNRIKVGAKFEFSKR
ncbi:MAG: DUF192 domain-containing protein [Bdellovibrionaceae bacterium]|nr:DUF192 domain-containing protein [Pseudobdellovibrionaceae bacterium]